jgi:ATP-binding cassette subfamily F protein 3
LIQFTDIALRRGAKLLFEQASFQVHARQRLGLIGANGCGKSSLFALLLGELEADLGNLALPANARIAHVEQSSPSGRRSALAFVQDGDPELRAVQRAIAQAENGGDAERLHELYERLEALDGFAAEARAGRLLAGLGFSPDDAGRAVDDFSGGWRMRLNLARALMRQSDILLLDEPTNHLDLPAILWLEQWLRGYPGILLVISHDRDFLDAVCDTIAHIEHQRIRLYAGNYSDFEQQRSARLAQQQALYRRQQREVRHIQNYVDRFRYKASKARQAQSRLKMLERMARIAPAHVDSPFHFAFIEPERQPHHLVQLESVTAGYGDHAVLRDVDLQISAGDRIGLLGVNGAGKSTLVKAIADGATLLSGRRSLSRDTRIGYFAQHQMDQLEPTLSPAAHLLQVEPGLPESEVRRFLGGFDFSGDRVFDPVAPFSGGEKARLVLALMIRQRPNLLLLDEPTNHLDLEMRQALSRALVDFEGAIVVIAHDRHLLRSVCDDLWVVHDGVVQRFDRSIDEYSDWLKAQQQTPDDTAERAGSGSTNGDGDRRERRRAEADKRRRLKPLTDRVRRVERELEARRIDLEALETRLADTTLYTDDARKDEMTGLLREQADLRAAIERLETDWLEASAALDEASG